MDVRQQPFSSRQILNKTWRRWQEMAPHPIPLPCALAFPPPSHRDATTPSPCWAPHFMTQERIVLSNPTPSKLRLSPAVMMSDDTPQAAARHSQSATVHTGLFILFCFPLFFPFAKLDVKCPVTSYDSPRSV